MIKIIWTKTDESPLLASYSLLPYIKFLLKDSPIEIEEKDISLAGRILALFGYKEDDLKYLSELVNKKEALIIKLPNISATEVQVKDAIKELREKGFELLNFDEKIYSKVLGSVVNPILRQGNSIRFVPKEVKEFFKHSIPEISLDRNNRSKVFSMKGGDFYENEKSFIVKEKGKVEVFIEENGKLKKVKEFEVEEGDIVDFTFMEVDKLRDFFKKLKNISKDENMIFSLHLKATMMKVTDKIIFGEALKVFFEELFEEFKFLEKEFDPKNGLYELENLLDKLDEGKKEKIRKKIEKIIKDYNIYMLDKNLSNFHRPNDLIIDASIPYFIKNELINSEESFMITIPDRTYSVIYDEFIENLKLNKLDPKKLGTVVNIGLMAKGAEEYGSQDKSFRHKGRIIVKLPGDENLVIDKGDVIFRASLTKKEAIINWINLAKNYENPIFWLDINREHDKNLIFYVKKEFKDAIIMDYRSAMKVTFFDWLNGKEVVTVTGNVLRDYLTDLFPILEVGTSSRTQSIIPLLAGGIIFETGSGGTAPKQYRQFLEESHLRWDSLGEFLALKEAFYYLNKKYKIGNLRILADSFEYAIKNYLKNKKFPGRKVGDIDTRISHLYFFYYVVEYLSKEKRDFLELFEKLKENMDKIEREIRDYEGKEVDLEGYYYPNEKKVKEWMFPSKTLRNILSLF